MSPKIGWKLKVKAALKGTGQVLAKAEYSALAALLAFILLGLMLWLFNLNLLGYIFFSSNLPLLQKFLFVLKGYLSIFTNFEPLAAVTMVLLVGLMSVNFSLLAFVLRKLGTETNRNTGKSGLSLLAAVLGSGCAVCGTGLLGPVLVAAGVAGLTGLVRIIGLGANGLGIGLVLYSMLGLGQQAAAATARENFN